MARLFGVSVFFGRPNFVGNTVVCKQEIHSPQSRKVRRSRSKNGNPEWRGEQRLRAELTSELPGSGWTLMKGYQNRRGEIDYLLIAPVGIMAFKCEHVAGTIICTKDRWVRQKYDRARGHP